MTFVPNYALRIHVTFLIWQETNWKLAGEDEIVGDDQEGTWACVKQQCWEPSAALAAPSILCSTWQMAGLKFSCLAEKLEVWQTSRAPDTDGGLHSTNTK